ncbi:MAG: hydrogen peroxide-inducible genes activator [Oligoflexia bacterium]|nr:hydrogen peroxide-inducible genes activator [Oligoflexia bacterium]
MTITQLNYVLAVDEFRHFKKAADSCHVSQPTLSMQLQKLEDELGVILFDRTKQPIIPTEEGEKVIAQARKVLLEYHKIEEVISDNELNGPFKIGVIPTLSPYVVPLFLKSFLATYPKIQLEIEEMKTEDILKSLDKDQIDVGILVTPLFNDQVVERALYYENFKVYVCPEHELYKKEKVKEKDLVNEGLWLLNEGHCFRDQVLNICKFRNSNKQGFSFESGSLETLIRLVESAGGYTLIPEMATQNLKPSSQKLIREFEGSQPTREVSLVYSRLFLKEKHIDALEEIIIENLPPCLKTRKSKGLKVIDI